MKRLALWALVCLGAVFLQLAMTFRRLVPHIDDSAYVIRWSTDEGGATGWLALMPYYAWPILVTYGGTLVVVAGVIGVAAGRAIMLQERQAIASREAAVGLQEAQVRISMAESERIRQTAESREQAARAEVAKVRQETAEQIEHAEFRLERSVGANIGRQQTIQRLRKRVDKLEEELRELRERMGEMGEEE